MLESLFKKNSNTGAFLTCKMCKLFNNTLFYITPMVAASEKTHEISVVHLAKGFFDHLA